MIYVTPIVVYTIRNFGPLSSGPQKGSDVDKQFCMHVETLPRRQTTPYARLDDSPGRAAASPWPEPLRPQASMARAPGDDPHPRRPRGSERKTSTYLNTKHIRFIWCPHPFCLVDITRHGIMCAE